MWRVSTAIDRCWYITRQTAIAKGVTVGDHSAIGACSFINHDIPADSITAGELGKAITYGQEIRHEYFPKVD